FTLGSLENCLLLSPKFAPTHSYNNGDHVLFSLDNIYRAKKPYLGMSNYKQITPGTLPVSKESVGILLHLRQLPVDFNWLDTMEMDKEIPQNLKDELWFQQSSFYPLHDFPSRLENDTSFFIRRIKSGWEPETIPEQFRTDFNTVLECIG